MAQNFTGINPIPKSKSLRFRMVQNLNGGSQARVLLKSPIQEGHEVGTLYLDSELILKPSHLQLWNTL